MNKIADILIVSSKGDLLLRQENDNPDGNSGARITAFGGEVRAGESPVRAAVRVLGEETGLEVRSDDLESLDVYSKTTVGQAAGAEVYVYVLAGVDEDRVHDYGGQGVWLVQRDDDLEAINFSVLARQYVADYFKRHKKY